MESIKRLQEHQYTLFERLREHFSSSENLQATYDDLRPNIRQQCAKLDDETRRTFIALLSRTDELLELVIDICSKKSCAAEPIDFSLVDNRSDTAWMVGNSPMKKYIDYSNYSANEIRIIEFGARRFLEGGKNLVSTYEDILIDVRSIFETCALEEEQ